MEISKLKIQILPSEFVEKNGKFNQQKALQHCGKIAGICYSKSGFESVYEEPVEKTQRRIDRTLNNGHHSVYDHVNMTLYIKNIPKILAMCLNNEKQYTTSERSLRYTPVKKGEESIITDKEIDLYSKWVNIFETKIKDQYGSMFSDNKIKTLAQENARYLVTVFMPTEMIYTTTFRQINHIAAVLEKYQKNLDFSKEFGGRMYYAIEDLLEQLKDKNLLNDKLMENTKNRKLSLFGENLSSREDYFSYIYSVNYEGSFVHVAQGHRHRTINNQIEFLDENKFYTPPVLEDDPILVSEWLNDINSVRINIPQGQMVQVNETGTYDNFILKCKERLCGAAQLEISNQTKDTLMKYYQALKSKNHPLKDDIERYIHGARCTFDDYTCSQDCFNKEAKQLKRKI